MAVLLFWVHTWRDRGDEVFWWVGWGRRIVYWKKSVIPKARLIYSQYPQVWLSVQGDRTVSRIKCPCLPSFVLLRYAEFGDREILVPYQCVHLKAPRRAGRSLELQTMRDAEKESQVGGRFIGIKQFCCHCFYSWYWGISALAIILFSHISTVMWKYQICRKRIV